MGDNNVIGEFFKIRQGAVFKHFAHLPRRAGENDDVLSVLFHCAAGSGSVGVFENDRAARHERLLFVAFGHRAVLRPEAFAHAPEAFLVHFQRQGEHGRADFLCQIVLCRTETARCDDYIRAAETLLKHLAQPFGVIAHNALEQNVKAERGKLF